jgi:4'-phosphopantetheinyl transferase
MRDVAIHCFGLDMGPERLSKLARTLSADEHERAARFRFDRHRSGFIACRGMAREILGKALEIEPSGVEFTYNSFGKPAVSGIEFNLSHSGRLAVVAVSRTREVGVDIERIDPSFAREQIPERFFSPSEIRALRALPEQDQLEAFFQIWTRKEAYVKARGEGLSIPLESFDVSIGEPAKLLHGDAAWSIESLMPAIGYVAAVAARGNW